MAAGKTPQALLWQSFRALVPTLIFDVGGTMLVYYLLAPHFAKSSVWPIVGASLVPVISNVFTWVRRQTVDIVGLIILIGLIGGAAGAIFGGNQRIVLLRESFITGLIGLGLLISPFVSRKPVGYYVMREFLTANEALPHDDFDLLWANAGFRRGVRIMTIAWGALMVAEFMLRGFMALNMNVAFVLGASAPMFTILLLIAGIINAIWLEQAIARVLKNQSNVTAPVERSYTPPTIS